jgi:hypothetical protein
MNDYEYLRVLVPNEGLSDISGCEKEKPYMVAYWLDQLKIAGKNRPSVLLTTG